MATSKRGMMSANPRFANTSLSQLVREGPPDGDASEALGAARRKVLSEGIKSENDGMVSPVPPHVILLLKWLPIALC